MVDPRLEINPQLFAHDLEFLAIQVTRVRTGTPRTHFIFVIVARHSLVCIDDFIHFSSTQLVFIETVASFGESII
jgi:hypothetical protein